MNVSSQNNLIPQKLLINIDKVEVTSECSSKIIFLFRFLEIIWSKLKN